MDNPQPSPKVLGNDSKRKFPSTIGCSSQTRCRWVPFFFGRSLRYSRTPLETLGSNRTLGKGLALKVGSGGSALEGE